MAASNRGSKPYRIVHLSDIHLAASVRMADWNGVRESVLRDCPDLIVVSGDFVEHPWPLDLALARREIDALAREANAQWFAIPGNHDGAVFGSVPLSWPPSALFDRIFYGPAKGWLDLLPTFSAFRRMGWFKRRAWLALGTLYVLACTLFRKPTRKQDEVYRPAAMGVAGDAPLNMIGLDSNRSLFLASGKVSNDQLVALRFALDGRDGANGLARALACRIVVVHHHPVPIPYSGEGVASFEPFLVLREAGTLLSQAAIEDVDLILHGHRHVRSFAQVAHTVQGRQLKSLAVLAAASPTATDIPASTRSYNVIDILANGRVLIEERFTHLGVDGGRMRADPPIDAIPFAQLKRRNFLRTERWIGVSCARYHRTLRISQLGTTEQNVQLAGLRVPFAGSDYRFPLSIRVDLGFLGAGDIEIDRARTSAGVIMNVEPGDAQGGGSVGRFRKVDLSFSIPTAGTGAATDLAWSYCTANNFLLSRWECEERGRPDTEYFGFRIRFPIEHLQFDLELPDTHDGNDPFLECRRVPDYPALEREEQTGFVVFPGSTDDLLYDADTTSLEQHCIERIGEGRWRLTVEYPLVGYLYTVKWHVADRRERETDAGIVGETRHCWVEACRQRSLNIGAASSPRDSGNALPTLLDALHAEFRRRFAASGWRDEGTRLAYLSYQEGSGNETAPRIVLVDEVVAGTRPVPLDEQWMELGEGASGLAFKSANPQLYYTERIGAPSARLSPLFDLARSLRLHGVLAIPLYHPRAWQRFIAARRAQDAALTPWPPSSTETLGILAYASDSPATGLARLYASPGSEETGRAMFDVLAVVQACAPALVAALQNDGVR